MKKSNAHKCFRGNTLVSIVSSLVLACLFFFIKLVLSGYFTGRILKIYATGVDIFVNVNITMFLSGVLANIISVALLVPFCRVFHENWKMIGVSTGVVLTMFSFFSFPYEVITRCWLIVLFMVEYVSFLPIAVFFSWLGQRRRIGSGGL